MILTRKHYAGAAVCVIAGMLVPTVGCELITDFDRTKIDAGALDATVLGDDGSIDGNLPDVLGGDAGEDTGVDTGIDASLDASDGAVDDADAGD